MINKQKNDTLIIFTDTYPYSAVGESFLDPELPILNEYFDKIIIVPRRLPSSIEKVQRELPSHVTVDTSFLKKRNNRTTNKLSSLVNAIKSIDLYYEILKKPQLLYKLSIFKKVIGYISLANETKKWTLNFVNNKNINLSQTVFYTYWLNSTTLGIGLAKTNHPNMKLISRAHGLDLYEDRHNPPYIPFRPAVFRYINKLYLISEHGRRYLSNHYPKYSSIYDVSRLGVFDPKFTAVPSSDKVFRILSCSYIVPVKRLELLIQGLKELGNSRPEQYFEWAHIGYGPLFSDMEKIARSILPKNVNYNLFGYFPKEDVLKYYEENSIDVFINVSKSEGIPVSIMEAQSYGVPVIATAVGGTPEIVSNDVGILLDKNPTSKEISDAICTFLDNPEIIHNKKLQSKTNWSSNYNAEDNFTRFALMLNEL
ncbi:MAG: glycosyltransferase [Methanosarcinaceae archaeon]